MTDFIDAHYGKCFLAFAVIMGVVIFVGFLSC